MAPSETSTITDPRFKSLYTDPRFLRPSKRTKNKALNDERFKPVAKSTKKKSNVSNSGTKEDPHASKQPIKAKSKNFRPKSNFVDLARGQVLLESSDEEQSTDEDDEKKYFEDSPVESDDEDDETELELGGPSGKRSRSRYEQSADLLNIDLDESNLGNLTTDEGTQNSIQPTKRIAVVNLDWDHVKPIDLYKVFSSLLSPNALPHLDAPTEVDEPLAGKNKTKQAIAKGQVIKVSIYKSQFGKEQMSKEDVEGPPRELFKDSSRLTGHSDDESSDDALVQVDEGVEIDEEALRRYQLNRLRYFYAVVELDSIDAAAHVYEEIEGTEFERTANVFDLSYVPEDMQFDEADLHDECKEDSANYKGVDYATDALRHSKVKLTWDAEDPHRTKVTRLNTQKMTREELDELDFRAFVAPPSSEEEDFSDRSVGDQPDKKSHRSRLRALLGLSNLTSSNANESAELDITFGPAFSEKEGTASTTIKVPSHLQSHHSKVNQLDALPESDMDRRYKSKDPSEKSRKAHQRSKRPLKTPSSKSPDASADESGRPKPSGVDELALLFDANEERDPTRAHFDLNQIFKTEKLKGRSKALKKMKRAHTEPVQDDRFEINTADDRFAMVYNDHEFAIDPSNPQYKKTKNMSKLLEAARSQRNFKGEIEGSGPRNPSAEITAKDKTATSDQGDQRLGALVASLKKEHDSLKKRKR
ncbi:hypothetical protein CROQUDRAFT_673360 [Cronartium quercuum f. sp. fusiforme G11]|uniref:NUC153 domain-containing protein n=1 Tax=Cronartium quercuum f. sp. fusiforme G11 TaxID=708437 RepID=A0A9P6NAV4_9BASI|nr:hypothetical protein CROQUDRAFT_673360 [Cronartium quercuum f. sp. fusiforme G11]